MLAICIIFIIAGSVIADKNPVVQTINGKVRGEPLNTFNDNIFYAFQGIPFAEPPVNDLRFQAPRPAKNWIGVLGNQNAKKVCIQSSTGFRPGESEDCLYLNVYTPQLPTKQNNVSLPVMVYIYGGAFVRGSNSIEEYQPHKIMDYGVVMVAILYRVGLFGFLSTGDLECPGNNGLKDQQLALRWVQANIQNFGGDPTRVTVAGQSAGAASVGYQLLGSDAEGLFRGVIQASGSSLGTWSLQRDPKNIAWQVANYIDSNISENITSPDLMTFFRNAQVAVLKDACINIFGEGFIGGFYNTAFGFVFSGTIEPEHDGAFLTDTAFNKFQSGNFNVVPTLIGVTSEELILLASDPQFEEILLQYDRYPERLVSPDMHITDQRVKRKVGNYIRKMYVGDGLLHENIGPAVKYFSDEGFGIPNSKQAKLEANYTDVYFYEFGYSGEASARRSTYIPGAESVGHGSDIRYVFIESREQVENYVELDLITIDRMVLIWTNFVKYLNPTPEPTEVLQNVIWAKVSSSDRFPYLLINETIEMKYDFKKDIVDGYQLLYDSYAISPLDTY